jgi:hypothetical protein
MKNHAFRLCSVRKGWIRLANGRALTDFAHEYKPMAPLVFAALEVGTGLAHSGH